MVTLTFSKKNKGPQSIVVTDIFGKVVLQQNNINNHSAIVHIKGAPGIYVATITNNTTHNRESQKVVVK